MLHLSGKQKATQQNKQKCSLMREDSKCAINVLCLPRSRVSVDYRHLLVESGITDGCCTR